MTWFHVLWSACLGAAPFACFLQSKDTKYWQKLCIPIALVRTREIIKKKKKILFFQPPKTFSYANPSCVFMKLDVYKKLNPLCQLFSSSLCPPLPFSTLPGLTFHSFFLGSCAGLSINHHHSSDDWHTDTYVYIGSDSAIASIYQFIPSCSLTQWVVMESP